MPYGEMLKKLNPCGAALTQCVLNAFGTSTDMRVLDAGCGRGDTLKHLSENSGYRLTGLEIDAAYAELARGRGSFDVVAGDIQAMPFEDGTFDAVVSLNGFHAFPDKEAAYRETFRVLKPGGIFTGCFYVEGSNIRTDRMIKTFYIRSGFFTPPFETEESLRERLSSSFSETNVYTVESIAVFNCRK